jgi:PAS domain S-box-containing protein
MKSIKAKISGGLLALFVIILILGFAGILFVSKLSEGSKGTIKNNYASVQYTVKMLENAGRIYQLSNLIQFSESDNDSLADSYKMLKTALFDNLSFQSNNITENGESEIVDHLRTDYIRFISLSDSIFISKNAFPDKKFISDYSGVYQKLRTEILKAYNLNMSAILRRNRIAEETANRAILIMAIVGGMSFIITLSFIFSFPGRIVNPLKELTAKIKAISDRDYNQKLDINSKDELGELASAFNVMAVRLKEYEESNLDKLLFEKKRMDAVIQNLQDGVLILDENKKIIRINNTALLLTGLKAEDVIDHSVADVAYKNDLIKEITKPVTIYEKENSSEERPLKIVVNGKEQYFYVENYKILISQQGNENESKIGDVLFIKNITTFQQRDLAKTNLIATVSHEFKTPISSINLSLKLLEDDRIGQLNNEQMKLVNSVRTQSNRLSKFVNELLDFSQAETGNIKLNIVPIRPEDIVDLSVTALVMLISEKNIQLETKIEDNLPDIYADMEKTVWVLVNLLSNAIRYSPQSGTINLDVKLNNGMVSFTVKDNGQGIAEEDIPKIFDKFVQVGKKKKGTGLGLTISKEFVQAQGGKIWVKSKSGEGSEFSFSLPYSK